jgi:tetratricopeptide (TPR) repeat protein
MQLTEFSKGVYNDLLLNAADLNNRGRFDDAIFTISKAGRLCRDIPEVQCRPNMDVQMSRAINGKYGLILRDIDRSLNSDNLVKAEEIIQAAFDFSDKHRAYIPDNSSADKRVGKLYLRYLDRGDNSNAQRNFELALKAYEQAERICNSYNTVNCSDDLNQGFTTARTGIYNTHLYDAEQSFRAGNDSEAEKLIESAVTYREKYGLTVNSKENRLLSDIKQSVYNRLINSGRSYHSSKVYQKALTEFNEAKKIEENYQIRKNTNLNKYLKESAKGRVYELIESGNKNVNNNNLSKARQFYSDAKQVTDTYALGTDKNINGAMAEFKGKIFQRECLNAQNEYNDIFQKALLLIDQKQFTDGDTKLDEALAYADQYAQCEIDTKDVHAEKNRISTAVAYSNKIMQAESSIKRGNYKNATEQYLSSGDYFKAQNIASFGIKHAMLFDYILTKNSNYMIWSVTYFSQKNDFDKALELLKELNRRQTNAKYTKNVQTALGGDMAEYDFQQNPSANYKANIARHTSGNKFFKYFMKAYKKRWKLLD